MELDGQDGGDSTGRLPGSVSGDEASRVGLLGASLRNQDDLERDISRQADRLLVKQADERDQKRLQKTRNEKEKLLARISRLRRQPSHSGSAASLRTSAEISNLDEKIGHLDIDLQQIQDRIAERHENSGVLDDDLQGSVNRKLPNETHREFLIRTGKITPFSKVAQRRIPKASAHLDEVLYDAEEAGSEEEEETDDDEYLPPGSREPKSHRHLRLPGFIEETESKTSSDDERLLGAPSKRRRIGKKRASTAKPSSRHLYPHDQSLATSQRASPVPSSAGPVSALSSEEETTEVADEGHTENFAELDDGNERFYQSRLADWVRRRSKARQRVTKQSEAHEDEVNDVAQSTEENRSMQPDDTEAEWFLPHPSNPDTDLGNGFKVPGDVYPSLFDYQKTGVQWLWELYSQQVGGIVGDEMGLGKTIQIIAFLAGLHYSKKLHKPVIIVCPATVMKQWVNEFHRWWPPLRVSILHSSGSGMVDIGKETRRENNLLFETYRPNAQQRLPKGHKAAKGIVDRVIKEGHVLVTTYTGLQMYARLLIPVDWEYAVLDEGHKIRNPNTVITICCKGLRTSNRIILSGTPLQNNLGELWSLFDFIFPMRLGTLVNFRTQFEIPIKQGSYANASNLQVQTALKCAETLKDTISPYLLQRYKVDVAADLPKKSEQVLFCKLTKIQRDAYKLFLASPELQAIIDGRRQVLYGIDILRKICNHPDLQEHKELSLKPGYPYGDASKSGKMQVVKALLELWRDTGHKTLLFAQHRIMLDILENYVKDMGGFKYKRMDGNTPIGTRQSLVDEFNNNAEIHVFLLTTKVGGLGVNLTGADRVIIYDPDWNPSTDVQARERAWRLGQKREVYIYRLMTAGTIEEKIYHRQIFKQFLTNRILRDPKQRQTFQMRDLHDLFTLGSEGEERTETSQLFKGAEVKFNHLVSTDKDKTGDERAETKHNAGPDEENVQMMESAHIQNAANVHSIEHFQSESEDKSPDGNDNNKSDARVLESIFARSGVQSAMEHDQIVNGKRVISADPRMIENEAKRVAAQAAKELQKAGKIARTIPVGTVTWTGENGTAGRPEFMNVPSPLSTRNLARRGPSGASVLATLQQRRADRNITPMRNGRVSAGVPTVQGTDFLKMILNFIRVHDGKVYTQMLIDHFNRYCTSEARTAEFKEMLKQIATLERGSRGRGQWVLRQEYR